MDLNLKGKNYFVSGSTSGIGLGIAKVLLAEGANVILNGRSEARYQDVGANASFVEADVSTPAGADKVTEFIKSKGPLHGLVCNVGSGSSVAPGNENLDEWNKMLRINLFSATNLVERLLPELKKTKGSIVCISSICGSAALGAPLTYNAAKAALESYVNGLARVVGADGVRINSIAPGNIMFPGSVWERKQNENKAMVEDMLKREVPLGRLGSPEEIGNLAAFLLSEKASFITGANYVADGGQLRV